MLYSIEDHCALISNKAQSCRLSQNLSQVGLSKRAGVSLGSIKRFEQSGQISLKNLIKLAMALGKTEELILLFPQSEPKSLDELMKKPPKRLRGRIR